MCVQMSAGTIPGVCAGAVPDVFRCVCVQPRCVQCRCVQVQSRCMQAQSQVCAWFQVCAGVYVQPSYVQEQPRCVQVCVCRYSPGVCVQPRCV